MKVVLAEKPSVARDIASVLGANTKKDGYFEGNDWSVTYAFGHLIQIAEPEEMNPLWGKPWRLDQLPMIPKNWQYRVADKAATQFAVIKKLFLDPATTKIIAATDAGREGEHIFRLIYKMTGSKKSVERLWISSLTTDAIKTGFLNLKQSKEFDSLADAATARAHADWIVGLNFTRAYTTINHQLCTVGRVQTPTLGLIVERQIEIEAFKPSAFFEILATFEPGFLARYITAETPPQTRLPDRAQAQKILLEVQPHQIATIEKLQTQERRTKAPALYDLLTLQKEANRQFGYTAQETLDIAQSLYEEHKLLSYPRTESRHLSTDLVQELPRILSNLLQGPATNTQIRTAFAKEGLTPAAITTEMLRPRLSKSYVDDTKLTDHHAIIPTHKTMPAELPERQRNVYMLVASRFLSIFLQPEIREETEALIRLAAHLFRAKGVVVKDPGWTILEFKKEKSQEDDEEAQQLPALMQGQQLTNRKAEIKEGKTSPPKPYDDAALLTAMKNAGREIDDEDLASYMKQSGLGTPATRAAIIERLIQSGYIERKKKNLLPTEKGKALIATVHSDLKNIALTARWEQQLADMTNGKADLYAFETDIANFILKLLPQITKQDTPVLSLPAQQAQGLGQCPLCKTGTVRETPKGLGCSRWREDCKFSIWREQYGKKLTDAQLKELFEKRRTKVLKGFKKRDGSGTYDARLTLTAEFKVRLEFDK